MTGDSHRPPRSGCAINDAIEVLGDPWSMLVELCGKFPGVLRATLSKSARRMPVGQGSRQDARSALKHRPADVVPQPLVIKHERANSPRQLITLPLALESPCSLALAFGRSSTCGLDRIGGRAKLVRGNMGDGPGLASGVCGMPCCTMQVSGRAHCVASRCASFDHLYLTAHPGARMLDRPTRAWVPGLSRLEEV